MTTVAFEVKLSETQSAGFVAKQARIARYADDGWDIPELAVMFGISESWTKMILRDRVKRFFCAGCGAPALKKNAECPRCDDGYVVEKNVTSH